MPTEAGRNRFSLAGYAAEAAGQPFEFVLDGGDSILIPRPAAGQAFAAASAASRFDALALLAGDQFGRIVAAVADEDAGVLIAICRDVFEYFAIPEVARLAYLIERYGEAIEVDLHRYYQIDLLDLWRDRLSPRKLLALIDHLPRTSAFMCAVADDDDLAESMAPPKSGPPPLSEWDAQVERLTAIHDRLGELIATVASSNSTKRVKPPRPAPRPRTAYDRIAAKRRRETADWIREQVKPAPGKPTMADLPGSPDPRHQMTRR